MDTAEKIARAFHQAYERLAPEQGYRTREASAVPWSDLSGGNKGLMIATVTELLDQRVIAACDTEPTVAEALDHCILAARGRASADRGLGREPLLGDTVWYRDRDGVHALLAATVTATKGSLEPLGAAADHVPALTDQTHVHLWVHPWSDVAGFPAYNVPAVPEHSELAPGQWRPRPTP